MHVFVNIESYYFVKSKFILFATKKEPQERLEAINNKHKQGRRICLEDLATTYSPAP